MRTDQINRKAMDWFFDSDILQMEGTDDGALFVLADPDVDESFRVMTDDELTPIFKVYNKFKYRIEVQHDAEE